MSMDWLLKMFVLDCGLRILGGPPDLPHQSIGAVWHQRRCCIPCTSGGWHHWRAPNEMTQKYLEHHSSAVTPQNCEKLPLNKNCWRSIQRIRYSFVKKTMTRSSESSSFDKRRLNIGKKETLSPLPLVITVSMKSFPHNSSQNYTSSNIIYTLLKYERLCTKGPIV